MDHIEDFATHSLIFDVFVNNAWNATILNLIAYNEQLFQLPFFKANIIIQQVKLKCIFLDKKLS